MKKFKKVYLEITNICNLNCSFCPKTTRMGKLMSIDSFTYIIEEIRPYTDHVYFHLMGEPCIHPDLEEFLTICSKKQLKVNMTTNGTLLSEVKEILLEAPALRKVSISLHSFEANDQTIDLQEYIDAIVAFVIEATQNKIICELRLWNMNGEKIQGSNVLNQEILKMIEVKLNLGFRLEDSLSHVHRKKLADFLYIGMEEKFEWPEIAVPVVNDEVFCYGLRDQFGILVDGTVVPCCLDNEGNIPLGNIFDFSLNNILHSERARNLYNGFSRRRAVEDLCKRCEYAKRY
ncbi:MAG: radical SAM protein [Epulopiscium sp.]|mgnify:FL=1|nr:radical SAM protein [Candidatus Epulonipiscium sp.]